MAYGEVDLLYLDCFLQRFFLRSLLCASKNGPGTISDCKLFAIASTVDVNFHYGLRSVISTPATSKPTIPSVLRTALLRRLVRSPGFNMLLRYAALNGYAITVSAAIAFVTW